MERVDRLSNVYMAYQLCLCVCVCDESGTLRLTVHMHTRSQTHTFCDAPLSKPLSQIALLPDGSSSTSSDTSDGNRTCRYTNYLTTISTPSHLLCTATQRTQDPPLPSSALIPPLPTSPHPPLIILPSQLQCSQTCQQQQQCCNPV